MADWVLAPVACGTPSTALPKRGSYAGKVLVTRSGTPLPDCACGTKAGARCAREARGVGEAGSILPPGSTPCGSGVPGTEGPKPAGLANGDPGGAMFTGACTPAGCAN